VTSVDDLFDSEVVQMVVMHKWDSYGYAFFLLRYFMSTCMVALHVVISLDWFADASREVAGVGQIVLCVALLAYELLQLRIMLWHSRIFTWATLYNVLDWLALSLAFVVAQQRVSGDVNAHRDLVSLATVIIWMQWLFYLRGFPSTSAMIRMIIEVIRDARPFFVMPIPTILMGDELKTLRALKATESPADASIPRSAFKFNLE